MAQIKTYEYEMASDIKSMRKLYAAWRKTANERIRVITKPEHISGSQAYKYQVQPLKGAPYIAEKNGRTIFGALNRKASEREVREAFRKLTDFLGSRTSTVAGIKAVKEERLQNVREMTGSDLSASDAESLLRFLGSPEGKEAMQQYDSDMVVEAIGKALGNKPLASGETILDRWRAWKASEQTLAEWIDENDGVEYSSF